MEGNPNYIPSSSISPAPELLTTSFGSSTSRIRSLCFSIRAVVHLVSAKQCADIEDAYRVGGIR